MEILKQGMGGGGAGFFQRHTFMKFYYIVKLNRGDI